MALSPITSWLHFQLLLSTSFCNSQCMFNFVLFQDEMSHPGEELRLNKCAAAWMIRQSDVCIYVVKRRLSLGPRHEVALYSLDSMWETFHPDRNVLQWMNTEFLMRWHTINLCYMRNDFKGLRLVVTICLMFMIPDSKSCTSTKPTPVMTEVYTQNNCFMVAEKWHLLKWLLFYWQIMWTRLTPVSSVNQQTAQISHFGAKISNVLKSINCLLKISYSVTLLDLFRTDSHQEYLLVYSLWSGLKYNVSFLLWCGSLSHCHFPNNPRINPHACKDRSIIEQKDWCRVTH